MWWFWFDGRGCCCCGCCGCCCGCGGALRWLAGSRLLLRAILADAAPPTLPMLTLSPVPSLFLPLYSWSLPCRLPLIRRCSSGRAARSARYALPCAPTIGPPRATRGSGTACGGSSATATAPRASSSAGCLRRRTRASRCGTCATTTATRRIWRRANALRRSPRTVTGCSSRRCSACRRRQRYRGCSRARRTAAAPTRRRRRRRRRSRRRRRRRLCSRPKRFFR